MTRFPAYFSSSTSLPLPLLTPLLSHPRPVVRKRAITTIAQTIPLSSSDSFSDLLKTEILPNLAQNAPNDKQKTIVQLVSSVVRLSTQQISSVVGEITPAVVQSLQKEDEELRESCLQVKSFLYRGKAYLRGNLGVGVTRLPVPGRNFPPYRYCDTGRTAVYQVRPSEHASPHIHSLPSTFHYRITLLRLKTKIKRWKMKVMLMTTKMENSTSTFHIPCYCVTADWSIAGIPMMKTQAIRFDDRPQSYWQR